MAAQVGMGVQVVGMGVQVVGMAAQVVGRGVGWGPKWVHAFPVCLRVGTARAGMEARS